MTIYAFLYQPRQNVAPFEPLAVDPEIGFTTDDGVCPGDFLGTITKDKNGDWRYCQRSVSFRVRLSPRNLRSIADRIDHLTHEEDKAHAKARKAQNRHRKTTL